MDIPTTLVLTVVLLMAVAFIVQPFVAGRDESAGRRRRSSVDVLRERAELLADRNRIYAALRDLDFDFQTGKVAGGDYAVQRKRLVAEGVETLQQLDRLALGEETPEADPVEAAVLAYRAESPAEAAVSKPGGKKKCPRCGRGVKATDAFCGVCGMKLAAK